GGGGNREGSFCFMARGEARYNGLKKSKVLKTYKKQQPRGVFCFQSKRFNPQKKPKKKKKIDILKHMCLKFIKPRV
ncbi:hypothetical protein, partial [Enterobacter roggenkampii]